MDILILNSAYKHGITEANISYCLSHFHNDIMLNYPPVIHAMKLTKQYNFLLEGAEHEL
jgi:hypothetical protein